MSASFNILSMLALTALVEFCALRLWSRRRGFVFCVTVVAAVSGICWAAFYFTYLVAAHGPSLPRPTNTPPPVGSGDSWAIVMFMIYTMIFGVVSLIPAGITAFIYDMFKGDS